MPADDSFVYRSASELIDRHGEHAPIEAANRAAAFLAQGDDVGSELWKRICFAVLDLRGKTQVAGRAVH